MTRVKASTKRGQAMIDAAHNVAGRELSDVYGHYSVYKERGYNYCLEQFRNDPNARNFRITSYNTCKFTVAWDTMIMDEKTGELLDAVRIETADNSYIVY